MLECSKYMLQFNKLQRAYLLIVSSMSHSCNKTANDAFSCASLTLCPIRWSYNVENWNPVREDYELAIRSIQDEEVKRIQSFHYVDDLQSSMIGRLLLRTAASKVLNVPFEELQFDRSEKGRPFLTSHGEMRNGKLADLNISHHGRYCVLAAEGNSPVGIDVCRTKYSGYLQLPDYFNLMQRKFSSKEWDFICGPVPEVEQAARFFRLWTLKESFVKAEGSGLGFDLERLSFRCPTARLSLQKMVTSTELYIDGVLASDWVFEETLLDDEYCVAVARKKFTDSRNTERIAKEFDVLDFGNLKSYIKPLRQSSSDEWEIYCKKEIKHRQQ